MIMTCAPSARSACAMATHAAAASGDQCNLALEPQVHPVLLRAARHGEIIRAPSGTRLALFPTAAPEANMAADDDASPRVDEDRSDGYEMQDCMDWRLC